MNKVWNPNAQMAGLRFSGLFALTLSLYFAYIIALNALHIYAPTSPLLDPGWFQHVPLLPIVLSLWIMWSYLRQLKKHNAGGWQAMLVIIRDEYALSVYRKAGAQAFLVVIHLCLVLFYLSMLQPDYPRLLGLVNTQASIALLILSSGIVFGISIMRQLKEEDE